MRNVSPRSADGPRADDPEDALRSGVYAFAVQIEGAPVDDGRPAPGTPLLDALRDRPRVERIEGGVRVVVYDLGREGGGGGRNP